MPAPAQHAGFLGLDGHRREEALAEGSPPCGFAACSVIVRPFRQHPCAQAKLLTRTFPWTRVCGLNGEWRQGGLGTPRQPHEQHVDGAAHPCAPPVRCRRCGHKAEIPAASLILSHGWNREPERLPFRCSVCGAAGREVAVGRMAQHGG